MKGEPRGGYPETAMTVTVSRAVLMAAVKRGIAVPTLATALGVSRQAIEQRLRRYDKNFSASRSAKRGPRLAVQCKYCRQWRWVRPGDRIRQPDSRGTTHEFCSRSCAVLGSSARRLTNADIIAAIEMRQSGQTWTGIARNLHSTTQSVQRLIWNHLRRNNTLTTAVVAGLWDRRYAGDRYHVSWQWLVNRFGFAPSPRGAVRTRSLGEENHAAS